MPDTGTGREVRVLLGVLPGAVHLDAVVTGDSQVVTTWGPVEARGEEGEEVGGEPDLGDTGEELGGLL